MFRIVLLTTILLLISCTFQLGTIPIIVKNHDTNEFDYDKITSEAQNSQITNKSGEDCMELYLFFPTKLDIHFKSALNNACSDSNYMFNVKVEDYLYYFLLYGQECIKVHAQCSKS